MKRMLSGALLVVGVLVLTMAVGAGLLSLGYYTGFFGLYGCDHGDRAGAELLAEDPGFVGVTRKFDVVEQPYSGCEDDDVQLYAGVGVSTGLGRAAGERAIEAVLTDGGWGRAEPSDGTCFFKRMGGRLAAAEVSFESPFLENEKSEFHVGVTAPPWLPC